MKCRVKYYAEAKIDLAEIKAYMTQFSTRAYSRFTEQLKRKAEILKNHPFSCQVYEDDPSYRRFVVGDYLVFYRVDEASRVVEIYRVLHETRNAKKHL